MDHPVPDSGGVNVLVTGGTGFVGVHLCERLDKAERCRVHVLCRDIESSAAKKLTKDLNVVLHRGDVCDYESLCLVFENVQFTAVFHLAAVIGYSKRERSLMEEVNVKGTLALAELCLKHDGVRLIHCSSIVAVGASLKQPQKLLDEDSPYTMGKYNLGYYETKRRAELELQALGRERGLDVVIVCPSNVYGSGDATKSSRTTQVKVALGKFKFYTHGGINVVHVDDVVDGLVRAWRRGISGRRYILGGDNITVLQLLTMFAKEGNVSPPWIVLPMPLLLLMSYFGLAPYEKVKASTFYHWYSSERAQRELQYSSRPAQQAVHESVAWMKSNLPAFQLAATVQGTQRSRALTQVGSILMILIAIIFWIVLRRNS